jgi:hypothetical protein
MLRELFGAPIDPDSIVQLPSGGRQFREIFPPGDLLDDIHPFVSEFSLKAVRPGAFIRIARDKNGVPTVINRGFLPHEHAVMIQITTDGAASAVYVPIKSIVITTIKQIRETGVPLTFTGRDQGVFDFLVQHLRELNTVRDDDLWSIEELSGWAGTIDRSVLLTIIVEAREEVAHRFNIKLYTGDTNEPQRRSGIPRFIVFLLSILVCLSAIAVSVWIWKPE